MAAEPAAGASAGAVEAIAGQHEREGRDQAPTPSQTTRPSSLAKSVIDGPTQ